MAFITGYVNNGRGTGDFALANRVLPCQNTDYQSNTLSLPSNISGTATLRVWSNTVYYFQNQDTSASRTSTFYLCDSAGNNKVKLMDLTLSAGQAKKDYDYSVYPFNATALAGKTLYGYFVPDHVRTSGVSFKNGFRFSIDYTIGTPVTAGNQIKATYRSQLGISTTVGAVISDSHFSSGTSATASGFNSAYGL